MKSKKRVLIASKNITPANETKARLNETDLPSVFVRAEGISCIVGHPGAFFGMGKEG